MSERRTCGECQLFQVAPLEDQQQMDKKNDELATKAQAKLDSGEIPHWRGVLGTVSAIAFLRSSDDPYGYRMCERPFSTGAHTNWKCIHPDQFIQLED